MKTTSESIYSSRLKNNCPECFNNEGLELTFYQKWEETPWVKRATSTVTHILQCHRCSTTIYPVNWTEDIERVFDFHQKMAASKTYRKYKPLAYIVIALLVAGAIPAGIIAARAL